MKTSIQLPKEYIDLFNTSLTIIEGPNNALFLYTTDQLHAFSEELRKNKRENKNISYRIFERFKDRGLYQEKVTGDGVLNIPINLQSILGNGELEIKHGPHWIEVRYIHESSCHCDTFMCTKCIKENCKDTNCNMHLK